MFLVSCCLLLAFVFLSLMFLFFVRWTCALALKQPSSVTSDVLVWLVHRSLCCVGAFLGSIISFWFFLMLQARAPLGSCASVLPAGTLWFVLSRRRFFLLVACVPSSFHAGAFLR
jgi:hypothetical protein